jgi:hypothetical protein
VSSAADAAYFVAWIDRLISGAQSNASWNTETEKQSVLSILRRARETFASMEK